MIINDSNRDLNQIIQEALSEPEKLITESDDQKASSFIISENANLCEQTIECLFRLSKVQLSKEVGVSGLDCTHSLVEHFPEKADSEEGSEDVDKESSSGALDDKNEAKKLDIGVDEGNFFLRIGLLLGNF